MLRHLKFLFIAAATQQSTTGSVETCSTPMTQDELARKALEDICQNNKIPASNKPLSLRLGAINDQIIPVSCLTVEDDDQCESEIVAWSQFLKTTNNIKNLDTARKKQQSRATKWEKTIVPKFKKLSYFISKQEEADLANFLLKQLENLQLAYFKSQTIIENNLGNCGEQTGLAAINILQKAQEHNLELSIQMVALKGGSDLGYVRDHVYLLINGSVPDIDIKDDREKTRECLESIKKGIICDSWNNGLLTKVDADTTQLYDKKTPWTSINIQSFHFDFKKLASLPLPAQKLFCEELAKIKLSKDPTEMCENVKNIKIEYSRKKLKKS